MSSPVKRRGTVFTATGLLLMAAALLLALYNTWDAHRARLAAETAARQAAEQIPLPAPVPEAEEAPEPEPEPPAYLLNPEMEMPTVEVDGGSCIGLLEIPALSLSLPVMSEWSYPSLRIAPCRYKGSAYLDNLIILGHNYQRHFGGLSELQTGDVVTFTDADGNLFSYAVSQVEQLEGTAIEEMEAGDWDLTLFTCTIGGKARVTVRCQRTEPQF